LDSTQTKFEAKNIAKFGWQKMKKHHIIRTNKSLCISGPLGTVS